MIEGFSKNDEDAENITRLVDFCRDKTKADGTILLRDAMFDMAERIQELEAELEEARNGE